MRWILLVLFTGLILTCHSQEHDPENCPMVCNMMRDPLCAENSKGEMKPFGSPCMLKGYNCRNNDDFVQIHAGNCPIEEL